LTGLAYSEANCWGLVRRAYGCRGIELPAFDDVGEDNLHAVARTIAPEAERGPWVAVTGIWQPYDVVLMFGRPEAKSRRAIIHCGIVADVRHILHTEKATGAVLVRRDHPTIRNRIAGVYRHKDIA
jgi:hypothetical protein